LKLYNQLLLQQHHEFQSKRTYLQKDIEVYHLLLGLLKCSPNEGHGVQIYTTIEFKDTSYFQGENKRTKEKKKGK